VKYLSRLLKSWSTPWWESQILHRFQWECFVYVW